VAFPNLPGAAKPRLKNITTKQVSAYGVNPGLRSLGHFGPRIVRMTDEVKILRRDLLQMSKLQSQARSAWVAMQRRPRPGGTLKSVNLWSALPSVNKQEATRAGPASDTYP
jgi:hypothetical protein